MGEPEKTAALSNVPRMLGGLKTLWKGLPGWGRAAAIAAPVAVGGAALAGSDVGEGDSNKEQIAAMLRSLDSSRQRMGAEGPAFTPFEHRMFARHGLDPKRLSFLKTLSGLRKGMDLENRLLGDALGGRLASTLAVAAKEQLTPYA